jgi:hypothetical protein
LYHGPERSDFFFNNPNAAIVIVIRIFDNALSPGFLPYFPQLGLTISEDSIEKITSTPGVGIY